MAGEGEEIPRFHHKCGMFITLSGDRREARPEGLISWGSVFSSVALDQVTNRRFVFRVKEEGIFGVSKLFIIE